MLLYILDLCHSLPLVAALRQVFPDLVGGVSLSLVTNRLRVVILPLDMYEFLLYLYWPLIKYNPMWCSYSIIEFSVSLKKRKKKKEKGVQFGTIKSLFFLGRPQGG
jgi:hypothetical protein